MVPHWPTPAPTLTRAERDILYPVNDDEPMTSSFSHCAAFLYALAAVQDHLRDIDCLVTGDLAIYHKQLSPGSLGPGPSVVLDLLVAFDVTLERDTSYCLWEVGKMPELVMEMTSKSTRHADQGPKRRLYARLGVAAAGPCLPGDSGSAALQAGAELFFSEVLDTSWGHLLDTGDLSLWNPREATWYLPQAEARRTAEAEVTRLRDLLKAQEQER